MRVLYSRSLWTATGWLAMVVGSSLEVDAANDVVPTRNNNAYMHTHRGEGRAALVGTYLLIASW